MNTLYNIWLTLEKQGRGSDKASVHSYIPVYEEILAPYRDCARVLEIGIFQGHSLRMWEAYFDKAQVHGVDCSETPHGGMADLRPMIRSGEHNIHIFDACFEPDIKRHFEGMTFDVIIDDAAHDVRQQLQLYSIYKHWLSPGGLYIIEDIQDIDKDRETLLNIDPEKDIEIIDLRHVKGRYDDVLVIIKDKE